MYSLGVITPKSKCVLLTECKSKVVFPGTRANPLPSVFQDYFQSNGLSRFAESPSALAFGNSFPHKCDKNFALSIEIYQ